MTGSLYGIQTDEWLLLKIQLGLVAGISESLGESCDVLVAVTLVLLWVLLLVVGADQDSLGSLDDGGSSFFTLHVGGVLILIEGSHDIFDAVESDASLGGDLSLALEDWVIGAYSRGGRLVR
jgi:hypothetical protein